MNPFVLEVTVDLMKIEIPVSDEMFDRLQILSKQLGYDLEETSAFVLKAGISKLFNQTCATCGKKLGNKFVTCNSCSLLLDCGYLQMQFENAWKGDRWLVDPSTTCYSCLIIDEFEKNFDSLVNPYSEEQIWSLKDNIPKIIDNIITESIRTTGDGETVTMSFPIKTERVEPNSWNILNSKIDQYLIQILNEP